LTFDLQKLILDFAIGYEMILDPPIFADIGFLNISINDLEMKFDATTAVEDYDLKVNLTYLNISMEQFGLEFDGLNDFLYVMNGLIEKITGVVLVRTKNIVEE
jgi:hypothetical protein